MKNKKDIFFKEAINKQFEIAGHSVTFDDVKEIDDWLSVYKITEKQEQEFKEWFLQEIVAQRISTKRLSYNYYSWFSLGYSLTLQREIEVTDMYNRTFKIKVK